MTLDFVYNPKRRKELESILYSYHPTNNQRLFFGGFLHAVCKLSAHDIQKIIKTESNWGDYNDNTTSKQLEHLCGEPTGFCGEDPLLIKNGKSVGYRECKDNSVFSKLNKKFFKNAEKCSYEYALDCFNCNGKMQFFPLTYPIYRTIENIDGSILFYIDLDTEDKYGGNIELTWSYAKQLYELYDWEGFKFSGSCGFHLYKTEYNKTRKDLLEKAKELYESIQTNLTFFGYSDNNTKPVLIDVCAYNKHRFVRGYCINLKSKWYSIPVNVNMDASEIINVASDINKIKEYLNGF